jgi:copper chaperone CopZ
VRGAEVSLEKAEARVRFEEGQVKPEALAAAVNRLGFSATLVGVGDPPRPTLRVTGLTGPRAARQVEETLRSLGGVREVRVSSRDGEVFVEYDRTKITPERLILALQAAGFKASLPE